VSYYIAKTVAQPFDDVVSEVVELLRVEGFCVLTDIDVGAALKSKIGVEMSRYRILGTCHPSLAHEALKMQDKLGVLLPCNVIVHETADRRVEVASVDPIAAMESTGNPALARIALTVRGRLARVVDGIASAS
jgi:uncharacterized protein (DUF302 family)